MRRSLAHLWLALLALIAVAAGPRAAMGQMVAMATSSVDSQTDKLSGFSVRREQRSVSDALEDFERYRDKKAWEKAFAAMGKIEDAKPGRLVPDKDGFYVPTELKIRAELLSLPPEGREAYRLFNDAKAAQLLHDLTPADGSLAADEIAGLTKIVNRYFITSIGDQAADRLGDALFEAGDFSNASRCWEMILDSYPDSSLSPVLLQTKRAIALTRAGDWNQFEAVRAILHDRYAGQAARIGGQDVVAASYVEDLKNEFVPTTQSSTQSSEASAFVDRLGGGELNLPDTDHPVWQFPLMDTHATNQLLGQLSQMGWGQMASPFISAVPATAVDADRMYVNWLGICFAADLKTGKLLWRTDSFMDMPQKMAQSLMQGTTIDPKIYSTTVVGAKVLFTRRSTDNQDFNQMPMTRLLCVSGASGKAVWKSEGNALSSWGFVGFPLVRGDVMYILGHASGSQDLSLLCIGVVRGDLKWKADLGTPATSVNWRGQPTVPVPTLLQQSGKIFVLTNNGAFLQVDCTAHAVDWALCYPTYVEQQQQMWGYSPTAPAAAPGTILCDGPTLYFKECNNTLLYAIDPSGPALKWKRQIDAGPGLAGVLGGNLLLAGPEIECVDRESRVLQWADKTSLSAAVVQPLLAGDWLYVFGSRGVESVRLGSGETGRQFRGSDRDADGGVLWKTSDRLVTVSSRAITAYAVK